MELSELVEDYVATGLLSNIELDFLEAELWEIIDHIEEISSLKGAPNNICKELNLKKDSSWQLCCATILDIKRPINNKTKQSRFNQLDHLIKHNKL